MKPKDEARAWLDERCGRDVHVHTHLVNATTNPLVNQGQLSKPGARDPELAEARDDSDPVWGLYQVGAVSYNLGDLPDDVEVRTRVEPVEQLEMTFDDGTSLLITVRITVITTT